MKTMNPFDTTGFQCRGDCPDWSKDLLWFQNAGDIAIWAAYMVIPAVILFIAWKRQLDLRPFLRTVVLFGLFIFGCGMTHFSGFLMTFWPAWWLDGIVKHVTAVLSWLTVLNLCWTLPKILDAVSPKQISDAGQDLDKAFSDFAANLDATKTQRVEALNRAVIRITRLIRRVPRGG